MPARPSGQRSHLPFTRHRHLVTGLTTRHDVNQPSDPAVGKGEEVNHPSGFDDPARPWPSDRREQRLSLLPSPEARTVRSDPAALTVVLADTQPAIRHGVRSVLEQAGGVAVVGEAGTAEETIAQTSRHRPDVLVVDPQIGSIARIDVIDRALHVAPETRVLVLSAADDDKAIRSAIHSGARGYLTTDADPDQILRGIRAVAAGEGIVGRAIAGRFSSLMGSASGSDPYPFPELTAREREVLNRIAAGKSNVAIARDLALAPKTISNRVSTVFGKLGVTDRAQAIVLARDAGLGRGG